MKKIVLAGGSGFIGGYLSFKLREQGYDLVTISRKSGDVHWSDEIGIMQALNEAKGIINLAGKSVDCRYTEKNRRVILHSRLSTTEAMGSAILHCDQPPSFWINASTATIYRHAEDRPMNESEGEIGSGFSVDVARKWEQAFFDFNLPHTRQIALRMAIVLGKEGGAMKPLKTLTRLGLGGKQGKGTQMFSWIHIEDLYQIILFLIKHPELNGVFNCAAPNPVTNREMMHLMRKMLRVPFGLSAPEWLLKIGAFFIRTETELVLKSRWVEPSRLIDAGFRFRFAALDEALNDVM